jgi:hypothetical protein
MSSTLPTVQPGDWSIRCYRLLMHLYPRHFTAEFGNSIDQAFRDSLRDAFQKRGYSGIALLWFRIIPDFVFSVVELLTSTAGDYLKWYFRLRWILACALAIVVGEMTALLLINAGVLDYLGLPRHWGLAGLPLWLTLGFFQSRVLTARFCHPLRWTVLTAVGGVSGILANLVLPLESMERWDSWLLQVLIGSTATAPLAGVAIGLFQWAALKPSGGSRARWVTACALGGYVSAVAGMASGPLIWSQPIHSFIVGAAFGVITAIALKRILWPHATELAQPQAPTNDAEASG